MRHHPLVAATCLALIAFVGHRQADAQTLQAGASAPDFTLAALDSSTVHLAELRGHPVIINFWATWCAPCVDEMPELASRYAAHRADGLVVLAVNGDREKEDKVRRFTARMSLAFPVLLDPRLAAATAFGVTQLPTTVFVDSTGVIRYISAGPILASQLEAGLRTILPVQ